MAIIGGAIINTFAQGIQGNINSPGDLGKTLLIGGASGAAGFGAGKALGLANIGFLNGGVRGLVSGASSGFVSGAGSSWSSGASFGQGLIDGGVTAGIAGLTGGIIGGLNSGFYALEHGGNFWNGVGASFGVEAGSISYKGQEVEYSTESARGFTEKYFTDVDKMDVYANDGVGCRSCGALSADGKTFEKGGKSYLGMAYYQGKGRIGVHLARGAFSSKELLYLTLGHEFLHGRFILAGYDNVLNKVEQNRHHAWIYTWEHRQSVAWRFPNTRATSEMRRLTNFRTGGWDKYFFKIRKYKPW